MSENINDINDIHNKNIYFNYINIKYFIYLIVKNSHVLTSQRSELFVGIQSSRLTFFTHIACRSGSLGNRFIAYPLAAELLQYRAAQPPIFIININIFDAANSFHLKKIYKYTHQGRTDKRK